MTLDFSAWKRPDGGTETITLVGVAPDATMGLPWNIVREENPGHLLAQPDGVLIDHLYADKLGVAALGQLGEINGVKIRIVGVTHDIRTFTQSPFVFTSLDSARRLMGLGDTHLSYVQSRVGL